MDVYDLKARPGTSVTPVREAVQMLNQEGLIRIKPRLGYFVIRITLKAPGDMLDLHEILEVAGVEKAVVAITDAVVMPTPRSERERCLFKFDGSCRKCEKRCLAKAPKADRFRRCACFDRLLENAGLHQRHGLADACGKCAAIVASFFKDTGQSCLPGR